MPSVPINQGAAVAQAVVEPLRRRLESSLARPVELVETHISWVLLDGVHAWKIKKPVRLGFLDFAALETRRHSCEEELRLNRRLAADLYLDVVAIRGSLAEPRLDGEGAPIEYAVRMRQFAAGSLFSERLAAGTLTPGHIDRFAHRIAAFQRTAAQADRASDHGSAARIRADTAQVFDGLVALGSHASWVGPLRERLEAEAARLEPAFEQRKAAGWIREGHGDLHLANVVVLGDEVTAFDCIEFDPALRWIDVQSDVAFLVMDLLAHGRGDLAYRFVDAWLCESGDYEGLRVLRYYLAYRALVRALVAGIRSQQGVAAEGPDYAGLAQRLIEARDPRLMIAHGISGSGKSFVSQRVLERAGAIRLRSDVERKRLFGLGALDASAAGVDAGMYRPDASARTYDRLFQLAGVAIDAGWPTIVDATFLRADERRRFAALARVRGVPYAILHCHAEVAVLRERVRSRTQRGADPSEADLAVLERQLARHDALGEDERRFAIDVRTDGPFEVESIVSRWVGAASTGLA